MSKILNIFGVIKDFFEKHPGNQSLYNTLFVMGILAIGYIVYNGFYDMNTNVAEGIAKLDTKFTEQNTLFEQLLNKQDERTAKLEDGLQEVQTSNARFQDKLDGMQVELIKLNTMFKLSMAKRR